MIRLIVFRPDIIEMVDWALKKQLPTVTCTFKILIFGGWISGQPGKGPFTCISIFKIPVFSPSTLSFQMLTNFFFLVFFLGWIIPTRYSPLLSTFHHFHFLGGQYLSGKERSIHTCTFNISEFSLSFWGVGGLGWGWGSLR